MKNVSPLLLIAMIVWSCADHEATSVQTLTGKWLLIEEKIGTGPPGVWLPAAVPVTIEYKADGTFTTTAHPDCTGTYTVTDDILKVVLDCAGQQEEWSDRFHLDTHLTLTPAIVLCDEGCEYKYKKL